MPRNKRRCKTGTTVKFAQPTDEGNDKSSYESKLREWRKVRDSLETEGMCPSMCHTQTKGIIPYT